MCLHWRANRARVSAEMRRGAQRTGPHEALRTTTHGVPLIAVGSPNGSRSGWTTKPPTSKEHTVTNRQHSYPQSGITNRPPEHIIIASYRVVAADPTAVKAALEALRELQRRELHSDLDDQSATTPKDRPSPETGELGFVDGYDRAHLTITTGLSMSLFDKLGTDPANRPQDLRPIDWPKLGDNPTQPEQGDVLVQVCSDDLYVSQHVLHRIEEELGTTFVTVWTQVGAQRYTSRQGRTSRREGRALNGFLDGTSNLDPRHNPDDRRLVFVDPDAVKTYPSLPTDSPAGYGGAPGTAFPPDLQQPPTSEPDWTRNGTYMVVRSSVFSMANWDHTNLGEQEATIGRFKVSGAFLDLADDPASLNSPPAFQADQSIETVAVDAHTRKANPRRAEDLDRRIFRRGYPTVGASANGQLERGLLFVAFARTISTQFEFSFRAWLRNPNFPHVGAGPDRLFTFESAVIAGGYWFVPAIVHENSPWSWIVPA